MSGGHLDYFCSDLESHVGDFGDRELDDLVKDMAALFYEREWFLSGDICEGKWNDARDAFKKKWFAENARQERIETYLDAVRDEVLKSLGLSDRYCRNCSHWTQEKDDSYKEYGKCPYHESCLMHRSESCDKFLLRVEETGGGCDGDGAT